MLKGIQGKFRSLIEGAKAEIETTRSEIARLKSERERIAAAPLPKAIALVRLTEAFDRMANLYRTEGLDVEALTRHGHDADAVRGLVDWPGDPYRATRASNGFLWLLLGDRIKEVIGHELDAWYATNPVPPLSDSERLAALAKLDGRIIALERAEEAAIEEAEVAGVMIDRRPDADPRAVLGVAE